ncbi:cytidylyltransferase domain-containing protein [Azospirillum sp. Marseille-Q6669]
MRAAVVVFARMDSRRLPAKTLCPIAGRPLLGRVLDRVRRLPGGHPVVVATSSRAVDHPIVAFAEDEGVSVFRGDADDVAGRALACATALGIGRLVRVSADSPFIDPGLIERVLQAATDSSADIATNVFPRTYPPGLSVEAVDAAALRRMAEEAADPEDREHVTRFMYRHPERYSIVNVAAPDWRYDGVSLTVDTSDDLAKADWIAANLGERAATASIGEVVHVARKWPAHVVMIPMDRG